jgi:hypothetical protein
MDTYTIQRHKIENALDSCGLGYDLQQRLDVTMKRIAVLAADVCAASTTQALHDALTNRPQGIVNDSVGKDDAERAFVSGVVSILGALVEWDICDARRIAADLLEDVNDHEKAAEVREWSNADVVEELEEE